jgi:hypothetical protein
LHFSPAALHAIGFAAQVAHRNAIQYAVIFPINSKVTPQCLLKISGERGTTLGTDYFPGFFDHVISIETVHRSALIKSFKTRATHATTHWESKTHRNDRLMTFPDHVDHVTALLDMNDSCRQT